MEHSSRSGEGSPVEAGWVAREADSLIAARPSVGSTARPEWDECWARFETRRRVLGAWRGGRLNGRSLTGSAALVSERGLGSVEALEGK